MNDPTASFRQIAPGPSPTSPTSESPKASHRSPTSPWKKRVSTACLACKKSKRKCSGTAPCDNCRTFNRVCIFDESLDQRRRVAQKRTADELNYHRDMLNDLFRVIRTADETHALKLLEIIRKNATAEEIRAYIDETLVRLDGGRGRDDEAVHRLEDVRRMINVEGAGPAFRRKVMDIHYLCDEAPCSVPARPWTSVTEDADLVSHLVSLYFTWDYPFHAFLDRDVFLSHMAREVQSEFCSPFLVNALLANACHFSEFSEAYVVPGDLVTKGADFLSEAERLREEDTRKLSLAYLQGTLLLYEKYSISGNDDLGYIMLHQAIRAGESLGLFGPKSLEVEDLSPEMEISLKRTAWGLFHVDTTVHTGFLRPSLIDKVNLDRVAKDDCDPSSLWTPYPSHRAARPAYLAQYFDESGKLCEIARDISRVLFAEDQSNVSPSYRCQVKEDLYDRLRRWHNALPDVFDPGRRPPPHIILLRMRYFTLVINLFSSTDDDTDTSSIASDAPKTPESPPRQTPGPGKYNGWEIAQSGARGIASLTRLHRREYGMSRAHHFALYAINLALFAMLEQPAFDVLDSDFLSLASSFSIVASRSALGRCLFHLFRQSVRAKAQGARIRASTLVSDDLKDLCDEDAPARALTRWDDYADGLRKLTQDDRYHGIADGEHGLQDYPGLGLFDMLDRYESLSLGKDEIVPERRK